MSILHVGCGWDRSDILRQHTKTVEIVGIDLDPRVAPMYHSAFVLGSATAMPFRDTTFDLVISEYVIEHVDVPQAMFDEIHRVLKPGGEMIHLTPNSLAYMSLLARLTPQAFHTWVGRRRYGPGHEEDMYPTVYRCNTGSALRKTARASGFEEVRVEHITNGPAWLEPFPIVFWPFHLYHRMIERWRIFQALRCALIVTARRPA